MQADPIRTPARAQDLTLRHRVTNYRAGDLERRYSRLHVHEDFFINYGFVTDRVFRLMHPRRGRAPWSVTRGRHVKGLLDFIRVRGPVHPRQVDDHFSLGTVTNYWGGSSSATTHLLDAMHYRGLLRVVRREAGIRVYGLHEHTPGRLDAPERRRRLDALVDVVVNIYAPLPAASLSYVVRRLRYAVPQWSTDLTGALHRARQRLAHARVGGVDWYWPTGEEPGVVGPDDTVRLLAPFDPVVWDRRRFELLWNWAYRLEAYTPVPKRRWGILRAATAVARRGHWLGQRVSHRTRLDRRCWLRRREAATRSAIPSGARGRARPSVRVSRPRRLTRRICGRRAG